MGEAKRISDRLKREREQSEREASLHRRAQTAEGALLKAQSEIVRLTAELNMERIMVCILHDKNDTAWNDAIEAAYKCADQDASAHHIRQDIRALSRPT